MDRVICRLDDEPESAHRSRTSHARRETPSLGRIWWNPTRPPTGMRKRRREPKLPSMIESARETPRKSWSKHNIRGIIPITNVLAGHHTRLLAWTREFSRVRVRGLNVSTKVAISVSMHRQTPKTCLRWYEGRKGSDAPAEELM